MCMIYGVESQSMFLTQVGVHGERAKKAQEVLWQFAAVDANTRVRHGAQRGMDKVSNC